MEILVYSFKVFFIFVADFSIYLTMNDFVVIRYEFCFQSQSDKGYKEGGERLS